jgi:hypothetical protein
LLNAEGTVTAAELDSVTITIDPSQTDKEKADATGHELGHGILAATQPVKYENQGKIDDKNGTGWKEQKNEIDAEKYRVDHCAGGAPDGCAPPKK